jgi:hypothetical protein
MRTFPTFRITRSLGGTALWAGAAVEAADEDVEEFGVEGCCA